MLTEKIEFPPVHEANKYGMVAVGGDLSPERLLLAYQSGIFPWYSEGEPIIWYSPDPRMVLFPDQLKVSKSMRQLLKKKTFKITENKAFSQVIANCKTINREAQGETGTWITDEMEDAYNKLHEMGIAKSVEVWMNVKDCLLSGVEVTQSMGTESSQSYNVVSTPLNAQFDVENVLVGGLYGLEINDIFCGESMFSIVSNASKIAFIHLVTQGRSQSEVEVNQNDTIISKYKLIDCQVYNDHLASLGAREISREEFLRYLLV